MNHWFSFIGNYEVKVLEFLVQATEIVDEKTVISVQDDATT